MEDGSATRPAVVIASLRNAARALLDPELQQSGQTRHGQKSERRPDPTDVAPAAGVRDNSADHGDAGSDRSDDVADPVHEVQERAFRLRPCLTLDRDICLGRGAKVLSDSHGLADHQKADCEHHGCYTYVLHLRVDLHRIPPLFLRPVSNAGKGPIKTWAWENARAKFAKLQKRDLDRLCAP